MDFKRISRLQKAILSTCAGNRKDDVRFSEAKLMAGSHMFSVTGLDGVDLRVITVLLTTCGATGYIRMCEVGSRVDIYIPVRSFMQRATRWAWACFFILFFVNALANPHFSTRRMLWRSSQTPQ
jgi:hypothetical protein